MRGQKTLGQTVKHSGGRRAASTTPPHGTLFSVLHARQKNSPKQRKKSWIVEVLSPQRTSMALAAGACTSGPAAAAPSAEPATLTAVPEVEVEQGAVELITLLPRAGETARSGSA